MPFFEGSGEASPWLLATRGGGSGGGCCSGRRGCSQSVCVFQGQPMDQAALFTPQVRPPAQLPQYPGLQQAQVLCCSGGVSA